MKVASSFKKLYIQDRVDYIFLDVDGVLNTEADWRMPYTLNRHCLESFRAWCRHQNAKEIKVVLSSTWKNGFSLFGDCSVPVQRLVDYLASIGIEIVGRTITREDGDRAAEITEYIVRHGLNPKDCIVLDDDRSIFKSSLPVGVAFYEINSKKGIS